MAQKSGLSKEELRRLMKEKAAKKIDSPFAKHDNTGQLLCILCKSTVKSEASWKAHENGRQHQLALSAGQNRESTKRKDDVPPSVGKPEKSLSTLPESRKSVVPSDNGVTSRNHDEPPSKKPKTASLTRALVDVMEVEESKSSGLPSDFFDSPSVPPSADPAPSEPVDDASAHLLPDDFFDKPTKNIKQKLEREKHKQEEEEWAKFQKAMHEETHKSAMAVEQDDEEARKQKELEEIEEQMTRWQKIHDLEIKREQAPGKEHPAPPKETVVDSDAEGEDDLDAFDWRKRKLW